MLLVPKDTDSFWEHLYSHNLRLTSKSRRWERTCSSSGHLELWISQSISMGVKEYQGSVWAVSIDWRFSLYWKHTPTSFHILPLTVRKLKLSKTYSERQGSFLLIWNIIYIIYMDFINFKLNSEYFLKNGIQKFSQQCVFISHDLC